MKTLTEIVKSRIERTAALMNDPEAMMRDAQAAEARITRRMQCDPSLSLFVRHYAEGLAAALKATPDAMHPMMLRSMLMQIVTEWEDVHQEFSEQLAPHP